MMSEIVFGPCKEIVLLGGGSLLKMICIWATKTNIKVVVITSPRHAEEVCDNITLKDFLIQSSVRFRILKNLSISEMREIINELEAPIFLSLGAAWIFSKDIISEIFKNKLLNMHGTRLPQNRGGGGYSWQILTANRFGMCMLHLIDGNVDSGNIVLYEEFLYPASCRIPGDYEAFSLRKYFTFITNFISNLRDSPVKYMPQHQQEYFSTYWPRLDTMTHAWIDWGGSPLNVERFICAFDTPYKGALSMLNNDIVHLKSVSLNHQDGIFHAYQSGIIYRKSKSWICVCLNGAGLIVEEVNSNQGVSIINNLKVGDRFYTPAEKLDEAKRRIYYNSEGIMEFKTISAIDC